MSFHCKNFPFGFHWNAQPVAESRVWKSSTAIVLELICGFASNSVFLVKFGCTCRQGIFVQNHNGLLMYCFLIQYEATVLSFLNPFGLKLSVGVFQNLKYLYPGLLASKVSAEWSVVILMDLPLHDQVFLCCFQNTFFVVYSWGFNYTRMMREGLFSVVWS